LLNNELYIGRYVWNRSKWVRDPDNGKRRRVCRPEPEWIVVEKPELRLVPQGVWERVKERQREQNARSEAIRRALHANARTGAGPKYLFSGLLKCGSCGANYVIADAYRYGCSTHINRGPAACSNAMKVPRRLVDERLLASIKADLFTDEGIELFKRETARLLAEYRAKQRPDTERLRKRLVQVQTEIDNLVTAIKAGILTPTTKGELEKAEAERLSIEKALRTEAVGLGKVASILPRAVDRYRDMVEHLEDVTRTDVVRARNQIKALLGNAIKLMPTPKGYLEAELQGDYAGLVALANESPGARAGASKLILVAGTRNQRCLGLFEPWFVDCGDRI